MVELWTSVDPSTLEWREWAGEFVVYDDASGDTHLLDGNAAKLLRHLCAQSAGAPDLVAVLAEDLQIEATDDLRKHVDRTLLKFRALGLIAPVKS